MKLSAVFMLVFTLLFSSIAFAEKKSPVKSITEQALPEFHAIEISGDIKVYITPGTENMLSTEISTTLQPYLTVKVEAGVLKISLEKSVSRFDMPKLELSTRSFQALTASGNYYLKMDQLMKSDDLTLNLKGAGLCNLNIEVKNLRAEIGGQTVVSLKGHAADAKVYGESESYWAGLHLISEKMFVSVKDMSKAEVHAETEMIAVADNSGQVNCAGKAEIRSYIHGLGVVNRIPAM